MGKPDKFFIGVFIFGKKNLLVLINAYELMAGIKLLNETESKFRLAREYLNDNMLIWNFPERILESCFPRFLFMIKQQR